MVGKGAFTRLASAPAPVSVSLSMCRSRSLCTTPIDHPLSFGGCNILFFVVFLLSFKSIPLVNAGGRWPFVYDWNPCTKFSEGENCKDVQVSPEKGKLTICLVREYKRALFGNAVVSSLLQVSAQYKFLVTIM